MIMMSNIGPVDNISYLIIKVLFDEEFPILSAHSLLSDQLVQLLHFHFPSLMVNPIS